MHLHAAGSREELFRQCEWCRNGTGNYCETWAAPRASAENNWQGGVCLAAQRIPQEQWQPGQRTPLCTQCEERFKACPYCCREAGQPWAARRFVLCRRWMSSTAENPVGTAPPSRGTILVGEQAELTKLKDDMTRTLGSRLNKRTGLQREH
eukprot:SAG11_NODE_865_length_6832_cov_21.731026_3_plen_151_part_00